MVHHWAGLEYLPGGALEQKESVVRRLRYLAIRITKKQGNLLADGTEVKYFCVVTNRSDLDGPELLRWHRGKAGTVEHAHDVLMNELAARAAEPEVRRQWLSDSSLSVKLVEPSIQGNRMNKDFRDMAEEC